jgi:hypothetical protein
MNNTVKRRFPMYRSRQPAQKVYVALDGGG